MRKTQFVVVFTVGLLTAFVTAASAQNPFEIEGVVLDTQNSELVGAAQKVLDISGSSKELGPKNGSPQQLGTIHTAPIPMLADTNPNGNNDLNAVWTQSARADNGDYWLYYGWSRDTAGTGIIGIELQKEPSGCDYSNLLACNPWGQRAAGDVVFVWDTQGGATAIVKRVFIDTNGAVAGGVVLPACPQDFPTTQTDECSVVENAVALFSNSVGTNLRGEAAINLTEEGLIPLNECVTFSNLIPFSGTGNSDSADIKDAVLNEFPPVTNCGVVTVKKLLLNLTGLTGTFPYTLDRVAGDPRPGEGSVTGTLTSHNDLDQINDLTPATNYTLVENSTTAPFTKWKVYCTLNGTTYTLFDASGGSTVTEFPVAGGATTACIIENKAVGSPSGTSAQSGRLHDSLMLSNVLAHPALSMTATFSLWTSPGCQSGQLSTGPGGQNSITTNVVFAPAEDGELTTGLASTLNTVGFGTNGNGTYYWKVEFGGDSLNASNSFCTEITVITFND